MSAAPPPDSWPFLGVFVRERPRTKDDDGPEPPAVQGLGFVTAGAVVTLSHIRERATVLRLGQEALPVAPALVDRRDDVVLLRWPSRTLPPAPELATASAGQRCQVAVVGDHDAEPSVRGGAIGPLREYGAFTVELDGMLREDETASGSPVVVDGHVVGVVGPTATNRSVDAFGLERFLATPPPEAGVQLSTSAALALSYGLAILDSSQTTGSAVLLGAMRYAAETGRTIAMALVNRLEAPSGPLQAVDELIARMSSRAPEYRSAALPDGELLASPLGTLLGEAAAIAGGPSELHMRHILVAAVMRSALPPALFDELGMSPEELRQALREAIEELGLDEPELVQALVIDSLELEGGISEDLVDPTEALDLSQDHLGVRDYVTMFAGVIAHDETPMPLSIGLFGEWGSGKSYFMALLRGQIETLRKSGDPHYLREIRQIGFNAWTYADSNLWASLGDEIFAQLAGPGETDERRRQRLQTELSDGLQRRRELAAATEHAKEETARLSGEIDEAARDRGVRARALTAALGAELDRQAQTAFKRIGVDDEIEQSRLLSDELRGAPADVAVIRRSLSGQRAIVLAACAVLTLAAIGVGAAASWDWLVGSGAAALVAVVGAASWLAARVRSGLGVLHRVADGVRQKAAGDDEVQAKLAQLKQAEAQEQVLRAQLDEVVARVGELGRELAELSPGQRLYSFVAERAASDDYRRQLGLISTIRKDLTQLVGLLGKRDSDPDAPPPIERIVLYIDDLDRCSPEQVVQVLQAVHLLLALDLFVVVVGVDPRWLLRALRREYEAMLTGHASDAGEDEWWQTTPQDYLEKIFNIPFALPRMSTTSFDLLVRTLAAPRTRKEEEEEEEPPLAETVAVEAPDAAAETPEQRPDTAPRLEVEAGSVVEAIQRGETPRPEDQARPLSEPELELLSSLAPLVETPREAKRLLNLYRMIRSTRNLTPAARFLGSEDQPGEYQAVVILLGLLSGHARQLEDVLVAAPENGRAGGLRHRTSGTWAEFVADIKPRQTADGWENDIVGAHAKDDLAGWQRLADGLAPATELVTIADLEPFQRWAPLIARFSFLLSPYAGQDEPKPG